MVLSSLYTIVILKLDGLQTKCVQRSCSVTLKLTGNLTAMGSKRPKAFDDFQTRQWQLKYMHIDGYPMQESPNDLPLSIHDRNQSRTNLNPRLDNLLILTRLQPLNHLLRVKVRPNRILGEVRTPEKLVRFLHRVEVINLRLDIISIRVMVVNARRPSMVDAPVRLDAIFQSLAICQHQVGEGAEGECEVEEACCVRVSRPRAWETDEGDAVVLFVVC